MDLEAAPNIVVVAPKNEKDTNVIQIEAASVEAAHFEAAPAEAAPVEAAHVEPALAEAVPNPNAKHEGDNPAADALADHDSNVTGLYYL